jgi:Tfp pilus assembly protein PilN
MKNINLLPWRAYLRERKQKQIKLLFCVAVALFFILIFIRSEYFRFSIKRADSHIQAQESIKIPFQLAGFLQENNQSWALIFFRHKQLKEVRVGDLIENSWRVRKITEHSMIVEFNHKKITLNN